MKNPCPALLTCLDFERTCPSTCFFRRQVSSPKKQALDQANAMNIIRILVPNFVVFIISLLTYLNLCAIKAKTSHQGSQETQLIPGNPGQSATFLGETQPQITDATLETKSRWNKFLFLFTLVFLALSGIASPSALSFPYLLLFLFLTTMYSFHVNLEPQRNVYKSGLGNLFKKKTG